MNRWETLAEDVPRPRVVVVDDDCTVREGVPRLFPELHVVDVARTAEEFLARDPGTAVGPDVVLLDLRSRDDDEAARARAVVQAVATAGHRILLYTNESRPHVLARCLAAGARGIVHKTGPGTSLPSACQAVAAGRTVLTPAVVGLVDALVGSRRPASLTDREVEVLRSCARGEPEPRIAARLHLSPGTVADHLRTVVREAAGVLDVTADGDVERALGLPPGGPG